MNDEYYIISLKWTYPNSAVFTFWRKDSNGYCWYREWAGKYKEEIIQSNPEHYNNGYDTLAIPCDKIDPLWVKAEYDKGVWHFILNTEEYRNRLGINKKQLKGGMSNIRFTDLKLPEASND